VCRLNFSHGDLDAHLLMLRRIHEAAARFNHPIAVLGDLGGPKIRLGPVADQESTGGIPIKVGDQLIIQREPITGAKPADGAARVSTRYEHFVDDVQVGHRILVEDGLLRFVCIEKPSDQIVANCLVGGVLKTGKGINLPDTSIRLPSITERDWECANWAMENNLDYLALSFVRSANEISLLRQCLKNNASEIQIIAKIEKAEAVENIDEILDAADGLMIARGDLGVEMDVAQVPIIQKDLIRRCQSAGKNVIVATQMLQSMIEQASPTRAEVSDVANAIFDGTDAIMLSGETSVGRFPVGTVHTMAHIAEVTEEYLVARDTDREPALRMKTLHLSAAMAKGAWQMVQDLKPVVVIAWSQSGQTARIFSKARFPIPVVALSSDHRVLRQMALHFGVIPQEMLPPTSTHELIEQVDAMLRRTKLAGVGDRVLIVAGASMGTPAAMDGVILHTVGQLWPAQKVVS
jgi:pyruvate kinase